jgi:hypothetical protein
LPPQKLFFLSLIILLNIVIQEAGGIAEVLQQMALWEQQAATAERNLQASISRAASLALVQFRV